MVLPKYQTGLKRFWAAVIDSIVFSPLIFFQIYFFGENTSGNGIILWTIFFTLISTFYSVILHYKFGQTVGKWAVGIKVVDVSETRKLSFKQALYRDGIYILIEIVAIVYFIFQPEPFATNAALYYDFTGYAQTIWILIELITMFTNNKRRALHDYLGNSVVVRV